MAIVLTEPGIAETTDIYGIVRIIADPDNERAKYAINTGETVFDRTLIEHLSRQSLRAVACQA